MTREEVRLEAAATLGFSAVDYSCVLAVEHPTDPDVNSAPQRTLRQILAALDE